MGQEAQQSHQDGVTSHPHPVPTLPSFLTPLSLPSPLPISSPHPSYPVLRDPGSDPAMRGRPWVSHFLSGFCFLVWGMRGWVGTTPSGVGGFSNSALG